MGNRLYSDLLDGSGRRYYFGLTTAPGGITNASPATLTLFGNVPVFQELTTVFRTPATAMLSLIGYSLQSGLVLQPGLASLGLAGYIPGEQKTQTITNALPPDYSTLADNLPTIIYIATISPTKAMLTLNYPAPNVTQGGNILSIFPAQAALTLNGQIVALPRLADVGALTLIGLTPNLFTEIIATPDPATLTMTNGEVTLGSPFLWVDDSPPPATTWIDDPPA